MWSELEKPWQIALEQAWDAYKSGTIPIGCVIMTGDGKIVSKGRNQIFDNGEGSPLAGTNMAHAEMNAMLGLNEIDHPNIREYILYTTMEPCPMCFGTMVMMSIRNIYYGARDGLAGASSLNEKLEYISRKKITVQRDVEELEQFQLILQTAYEYEREHPRVDYILNTWRHINNLAIDCGQELYNTRYFPQAAKEGKTVDEVYDYIIKYYYEKSTIKLDLLEVVAKF